MLKSTFKLTLVALFMAALAVNASAALTELDSSVFTYKSDMDVLPDTQGYSYAAPAGVTAATDGDILSFTSDGTTPGGWYSYGQSTAGTDWYNITDTLGYTIEFNLKIVDPADQRSFYMISVPSGSTTNGWLNVAADGQGWGVNDYANLGASDNTDAFHAFRVVQMPNESNFHVWRDGALVGQGLGSIANWDDHRIIWGGLAGANDVSDVQIDYVRYTSGAYAPVGGEIPVERPGHIEGGPVVPDGTTPYAWYRADKDVVTNNNSAKIAYWGDQSGNDRHVAAVADPQLTNNGASGQQTVTFDGDGDYLQSLGAEWGEAAPGTVFTVWQRTGDGDDCNTPYLYDGAGDQQRQSFVVNAGADPDKLLFGGAMPNNYDSVEDPVGLNNWVVTSTSHVTGSTDTLYINDEVVYTGNLLSGGMTGINIGGYTLTYGRQWEGEIAELIVFEGELSTSERSAITQELMSRWGVGEVYTPGDANKDGYVDVSDLGILATNYGAGSGFGWEDADFTGDGLVDVSDLGVLATSYGATPVAQSVPEPGSLALLCGAFAALLGLYRRRRMA